jgi:phenylacetate-coenzyme A ligase PaaK-like adenylate-forming protein
VISLSTKEIEQKIFSVDSKSFDALAMEIFHYQSVSNPVYSKYLEILRVNPVDIARVEDIPFLPISLFKTFKVFAGHLLHQAAFSSSGTTGTETSKHYVAKLELYEQSFTKGFSNFYGVPSNYCILALLPSYLEREGSSLIYMVKNLIDNGKHPKSGFYLYNHQNLIDNLIELEKEGQPTILIGVTYALLDLASRYNLRLNNTVIMETGGMKGHGKELIRSEVHRVISGSFGVSSVHSEYGMTELLSQAYSKGDGLFSTPPWMRVLTRDPYDPFCLTPVKTTGAINIIDLANLYSCSFLQTDDLGVIHPHGQFEILGRMDSAQVRGCNLLM